MAPRGLPSTKLVCRLCLWVNACKLFGVCIATDVLPWTIFVSRSWPFHLRSGSVCWQALISVDFGPAPFLVDLESDPDLNLIPAALRVLGRAVALLLLLARVSFSIKAGPALAAADAVDVLRLSKSLSKSLMTNSVFFRLTFQRAPTVLAFTLSSNHPHKAIQQASFSQSHEIVC